MKKNERKTLFGRLPESFFAASVPEMNSDFLAVVKLCFFEIVNTTDGKFVGITELLSAVAQCNRAFADIRVAEQDDFHLAFLESECFLLLGLLGIAR